MNSRGLVAAVALIVAAGCAARLYTPPRGPATPLDTAPALWAAATERCRGARLFVAEIRMQGWVGAARQRLAATVHGAVTRDDDVYLEVPAPGLSVVQMAGRAGHATFLLPRDRRVLEAPTRDIFEALTGLRWGGRELFDVLSGCVAPADGEVTGEGIDRRVAIHLAPRTTAWLRRAGDGWRVEAADVRGWLIDYRHYGVIWPGEVRVTTSAAARIPLDLTFVVSQVQTNIELAPSTFTLAAPATYAPMTLDDLRAIGPLGERSPRS